MTGPLSNTAPHSTGYRAPNPAETPTNKPMAEKLRPLLMVGFPMLMAASGMTWYVADEPYVSTDNAYARVAKASINARISGQVIEIAVEDNQPVRKGQLLFRVNPEPFEIAVNRAEAQLSVARLQIEGLKANYRQQWADLQLAKAQAEFDQKEFVRKKALVDTEFVSRATFERADTDLKVARQRVASAEQQLASTVVALNGSPDIDVDSHPKVREARAQLDEARLYLSYTTVVATDDGVVAKVDDLQVGNYVNSGAPVFALMSGSRSWIEANFRETDLTHMHPGQEATVRIDTYPDHVFSAHVSSMSPGTGSDFALLPPENATGNWVKVVQRVPVRLELDEVDPGRPLFSGISATVKVDTGYRGGWWHSFSTLLNVNASPGKSQ